MAQERIHYLVHSFFNNICTQAEQEELSLWIYKAQNDEVLQELLRNAWGNYQPDADIIAHADGQLIHVLDKVFANGQEQAPVRRMRMLRRWSLAASVILLLGVGAYLWTNKQKNVNTTNTTQTIADIAPGTDGAILTLADGSQVSLDSIKNGVVALQGGVTAKIINGALIYEGKGNEVVYNTMSTPKGRQYQVTLPDGTQVWLNAASSIRYPTQFVGNERRVEITGEAYFEAAKNTKMPFRVKVNDKMEVEVLGTKFNINAYQNEEGINTTLLEGAVKITEGKENLTLKPGEQARVSQTDSQEQPAIKLVANADLDKALAWKNGYFNFKGTTLQELLRQLERWYDIEVSYKNGVPDVELSGKMARDIPLQDLLELLNKMGLQFNLEGKKLIIL